MKVFAVQYTPVLNAGSGYVNINTAHTQLSLQTSVAMQGNEVSGAGYSSTEIIKYLAAPPNTFQIKNTYYYWSSNGGTNGTGGYVEGDQRYYREVILPPAKYLVRAAGMVDYVEYSKNFNYHISTDFITNTWHSFTNALYINSIYYNYKNFAFYINNNTIPVLENIALDYDSINNIYNYNITASDVETPVSNLKYSYRVQKIGGSDKIAWTDVNTSRKSGWFTTYGWEDGIYRLWVKVEDNLEYKLGYLDFNLNKTPTINTTESLENKYFV